MSLIEFSTSEELYRESLALRHAVLREPLGMDLYSEDLSAEVQQMHFGIVREGALIATLTVAKLSQTSAKIRQMAVSPDAQRTGAGSQLMQGCLACLAERGFAEVSLHARKTAIPFYAKNGFEETGEEFLEVSLPHRKMRRAL